MSADLSIADLRKLRLDFLAGRISSDRTMRVIAEQARDRLAFSGAVVISLLDTIDDLRATVKVEREANAALRDALRDAIRGAHAVGMQRILTVPRDAVTNWCCFLSGVADIYQRAFGQPMAEGVSTGDVRWDLPAKRGASSEDVIAKAVASH